MENNGLYDQLSARENLVYYARLYEVSRPDDRVTELLDFVGLTSREKDLVGNFSTGMKRKLGIARALLHEPEILFLDEPTSGLDPEAQHMVRDLILRLSHAEEMTVFLNSHNLDEVQRICSHVAILHRGRILALDSIGHLTSSGRKTVFLITLANPGQSRGAEDLLSSLGGIEAITRNENVLQMLLATVQPHEVVAALVQNGIAVDEARIQKRSLEEIYLHVMRQAEGGRA